MNRKTLTVFAAICVLSSRVIAGVPSLIAGLHTGDELRYTYTLTTDETVTLTGKTGVESAGIRTVSTQTVGVVFRVKAETTALDIVEATFEAVKVGMNAEGQKFDVDVAGSEPDEKVGAGAKQVYGWFRPLVGAKITLNVAPGSGEITTVQGGEELLKTAGAAHLRRYVDPDLFRATFGAVFQLKSNSMMPPPGEKWYIKTHEYARGAKAPVWETRSVEMEEGNVANVKGAVKASGKPDEAGKASVFFKSVDTGSNYLWHTVRGRMTKSMRQEVISTRFERGGIMQDSDLNCSSVLEMVEKKPETPKPAGDKPKDVAPRGTSPPAKEPSTP